MTNAEKPPIRITKQRAQAFLEAADRGIDEQIADLKKDFGLVLHRDGRQEIDGEFHLVEPGAEDLVPERVEQILRAIDTLAIFRRRYG